MINDILTEGYFNPKTKRDSVSTEDTKKRVMRVQQGSAVSDFKSLITGGYPDPCIGIKYSNCNNEIIEVDGKFKTISIVDNYGEYRSVDGIPDTLGYIFFRIAECIIVIAGGDKKGNDSVDVFKIDSSTRELGNNNFKKYMDVISQDFPNIIFKVDPSSLKGKLKTARFHQLLYAEIYSQDRIYYTCRILCDPLDSDNTPLTSVSKIDQNGGISVEFLYTPMITSRKNMKPINWITVLASAIRKEFELSDEEYSDEFTDMCRKVVHTEFETAKSESRKPSFANTVILVADKFFKKSVRQTVRDLRDDLKVISDCLSNSQPMYEIEYGCQIPVKLTAKFRMFSPWFEAESQKTLRNILGTGVFSESVNDFIDETGIAVFPSTR